MPRENNSTPDYIVQYIPFSIFLVYNDVAKFTSVPLFTSFFLTVISYRFTRDFASSFRTLIMVIFYHQYARVSILFLLIIAQLSKTFLIIGSFVILYQYLTKPGISINCTDLIHPFTLQLISYVHFIYIAYLLLYMLKTSQYSKNLFVYFLFLLSLLLIQWNVTIVLFYYIITSSHSSVNYSIVHYL